MLRGLNIWMGLVRLLVYWTDRVGNIRWELGDYMCDAAYQGRELGFVRVYVHCL